jgi:hypothetical protein
MQRQSRCTYVSLPPLWIFVKLGFGPGHIRETRRIRAHNLRLTPSQFPAIAPAGLEHFVAVAVNGGTQVVDGLGIATAIVRCQEAAALAILFFEVAGALSCSTHGS